MIETTLKTSIKSRIIYLQEKLGIVTQEAFAKDSELGLSTLKGILRTDRIGHKSALKITQRWNVSYDWIRYGSGNAPKPPIGGPITISATPAPTLCDDFPQLELYAYIPKAKSPISAGGGIFPEEEFEEKRYGFLKSWLKGVASAEANLYLIDIEGDSMEPTLKSGDTVLIDTGRTDLVAGAIFAIRSDSVTLIKRIALLASGKVLIKSDNPIYPPEEVWAGEIVIKGRMIWSARTWL